MTLRDVESSVRSDVRYKVTTLSTIVLLSACCGGSVPSTAQVNPCIGEAECAAPGAQLNVSYPYRLSTHCGVLEIRFDGRAFYLESLNPADVLVGLDQPIDTGTMVLLSAQLAEFRDSAGHSIRFVDSPPGLMGQGYPFTAQVSSSSLLIDARFAGRLWHALGTLPGVSGPPYGNGQDRFTAVRGTLTLVSGDRATFSGIGGATAIPATPTAFASPRSRSAAGSLTLASSIRTRVATPGHHLVISSWGPEVIVSS